MSGYRIILVKYIYPPIPVRDFDYQASFEGHDEGDPIGHGSSEQAAIDDLHENAEFDAEFAAEMRARRL